LLGAAFVTVGMVSAAFSALRRKHDTLLLYFALFAVLYGALCETLRKTEGTTPSEAADLIVTTVQAWSNLQEDDLTLLVCDYGG
jgi:hypothetical protein